MLQLLRRVVCIASISYWLDPFSLTRQGWRQCYGQYGYGRTGVKISGIPVKMVHILPVNRGPHWEDGDPLLPPLHDLLTWVFLPKSWPGYIGTCPTEVHGKKLVAVSFIKNYFCVGDHQVKTLSSLVGCSQVMWLVLLLVFLSHCYRMFYTKLWYIEGCSGQEVAGYWRCCTPYSWRNGQPYRGCPYSCDYGLPYRLSSYSWENSPPYMMMMMKLYFHRVAPSAYFAALPGGPEYR